MVTVRVPCVPDPSGFGNSLRDGAYFHCRFFTADFILRTSLIVTWVVLGLVVMFIGSLVLGHFYYGTINLRLGLLERAQEAESPSSPRSRKRKKSSTGKRKQNDESYAGKSEK